MVQQCFTLLKKRKKQFSIFQTEVTSNLSSNLIGKSNDETNLPDILLLSTDALVSKNCKLLQMVHQLI